MTLAWALVLLWTGVGAAGRWPELFAALGCPWPWASAVAAAIVLLQGTGAVHGTSVGAVLLPTGAALALFARLPPAQRERTLEAALLGALALVLGRALAGGSGAAVVATLAGIAIAVLAPSQGSATAAALGGLSGVPALFDASFRLSSPSAADGLLAGATSAVVATTILGRLGARWRTEGRFRL